MGELWRTPYSASVTSLAVGTSEWKGDAMKRISARWMVLATSVTLMGLMLSGCAWSIGSDKPHSTAVRPTRGQELSDLKKAKDQGAITEEEYEAQKKKILDQ